MRQKAPCSTQCGTEATDMAQKIILKAVLGFMKARTALYIRREMRR